MRLYDGYTTTLAGAGGVPTADPNGGQHDNTDGTLATFSRPTKLILSPDESYLLVSEQGSVGHVVRKVNVATGATERFVGHGTALDLSQLSQIYADGVGTDARFYNPAGFVWDTVDQDYVYLADSGNHVIRKIHVPSRTVTTWMGNQV